MEAHQQLGGRYVLLAPLGRGGMAVVWRARDEILGRTVAVKLLAGRYAGDPDSRRRIRAEARAAAALSHPNIAQVYDYGESPVDGTEAPYVVMELVHGTTLQERMMSPMSPRFAMRVCAEVAAALAAAHADGLVHRDIKPANVLLPETGAKVVDFGIAAAISGSGTGDLDDDVYGTPAYLAPERLTDDAVNPASDVYALGVLLYRLLSGHSPWTADTTTQMLTAHIYVAPEPLPPMPGVPGYVTELCNRCLSKDVTMRPSAREVAALLAQAAGLRVVADEPAPTAAAGATAVDPTPSVLIRRDATPAPPVAATAFEKDMQAAATAPAAAAAAAPSAAETPSGPDRAAEAPPAPVPAAPTPPAKGRVRGRAAVIAAAVVALTALVWLILPGGDPGDRLAEADPAATPSSATGSSRATATRKPVSATATAGAADPGSTTPAETRTAAPEDTGGPATPQPTAGATTTATTRPTPRPTATTQPEDPEEPEEPSREWSFSSTAGSVRATCPSPGRAELLSWTAKKPYKVQEVNAGPAAAPAATFKHGNDLLRMTVTCSGGTASASTDEV